MNYSFRITAYKNGTVSWMCDSADAYKSEERAIEAARYHCDYWCRINSGTMEKTDKGAKFFATNKDGERIVHVYEVVN